MDVPSLVSSVLEVEEDILDVLIYFLAISSFALSKKRTRSHTCEQILICGRSDVEQKRTGVRFGAGTSPHLITVLPQ